MTCSHRCVSICKKTERRRVLLLTCNVLSRQHYRATHICDDSSDNQRAAIRIESTEYTQTNSPGGDWIHDMYIVHFVHCTMYKTSFMLPTNVDYPDP